MLTSFPVARFIVKQELGYGEPHIIEDLTTIFLSFILCLELLYGLCTKDIHFFRRKLDLLKRLCNDTWLICRGFDEKIIHVEKHVNMP